MHWYIKIFMSNEMNQSHKAIYYVFHRNEQTKITCWCQVPGVRKLNSPQRLRDELGQCVPLLSGDCVKEYFSKLSEMKILLKCGKETMMKRRKISRKRTTELWSPTLSLSQFSYTRPLHSEAHSPYNRMGWGLQYVCQDSNLFIMSPDF